MRRRQSVVMKKVVVFSDSCILVHVVEAGSGAQGDGVEE